jgi:hypothetical protein
MCCRRHDIPTIQVATQRYRREIDQPSDLDAFVAAFSEWVEACWFAERDGADERLEAVLAFAPDVVLVGALAVLDRLLEINGPAAGPDVAGALAEHLLITGPDPEREALIRAVVTGAGAAPAVRLELLRAHGAERVTGAALECASVLAQALANRHGVVPSSILEEL